MKQLFASFFITLALTLSAQAACLSQADARKVVASGQAKSLGSVAGQAGGEIVKAQLCTQGGGYVYKLSVLKGGKVQNVTVNASR